MPKHPEVKINKHVSTYCTCTKYGNHLWYWRTKAGKLVYECNICGWAEVEE